MEKKTYDARGSIGNLGRLTAFDREAFYHLISYRLLIIASTITVVLFMLSLGLHSLEMTWKIMLVIVWLLLTSQVYESAKAFVLVGSGGIAFGKLNESYLSSMRSGSKDAGFMGYIPYVVLLIWVVGFFIFAAVVL